ncbi:MAG: hypothetical protein CMM47_00840 [Rhodospirillaceae bacterium]|nr:hypothetical protein [Rhodospirillaceae bacterium]
MGKRVEHDWITNPGRGLGSIASRAQSAVRGNLHPLVALEIINIVTGQRYRVDGFGELDLEHYYEAMSECELATTSVTGSPRCTILRSRKP